MSTYYVKTKGTTLANGSRVEQGSDNTNVTDWVKANPFIYCVAIGQDSRNPVAAVLKLQWRVSGGSFADLGATGALKYTSATDLSNGTAVTSGEALVSVANMTWQDGEEIEDGVSASIDLGSDYYSELQFAVDPSGATDGATYEFQLYNDTLGPVVAIESGSMLTVTMYVAPDLSVDAPDQTASVLDTPSVLLAQLAPTPAEAVALLDTPEIKLAALIVSQSDALQASEVIEMYLGEPPIETPPLTVAMVYF